MTAKRALLVAAVVGMALVAIGLARYRRTFEPAVTEPLPATAGAAGSGDAARPTPASSPENAPSQETSANADPSRLLGRFMAKYRDADRHTYDVNSCTRFAREHALGLTEGRLLCLSFPRPVLPLLEEVTSDASRNLQERIFGIRLLGCLAQSGRSEARDALLRLAADRDRDVSGTAVQELASNDPQGTHQQIYEKLCAEGLIEAFDAISERADPRSVRLMKELAALDPQTSRLSLMARDVLKSYAILESSDVPQRVGAILDGSADASAPEMLWALRVSRAWNVPDLNGILRRRLDSDLAKAREELAVDEKLYLRRFGRSSSPRSFEARYSEEPLGDLIRNCVHDDLLIDYASRGGPLWQWEADRLKTFGYVGDPRERLSALLSSEK